MFVKTTRVKRDNKQYEYLALVEAVRDGDRTGHRVLFRLGEAGALRASGQLDRIIAALQAHAARPWVPADELDADAAPAVGAVAAVHTMWRRLGLERGSPSSAPTVAASCWSRRCGRWSPTGSSIPCSKRRLTEWVEADVVMPAGFTPPVLHSTTGLDAVADSKEATEAQLYAALTDLTNLDLRLVCYDLTSTYFEGSTAALGAVPVEGVRLLP